MNSLDKNNLFGYPIRLFQLKEEDGGGWSAEVPDLPGCFSDGDTPEEALINIRDAILGWIEITKEDGKPVPRPSEEIEPQYSGKFTIRVPKILHKKLVEEAKRENISLNQFVNSLLSYNLGYLIGESNTNYKNEQAASDDEVFLEWNRVSVKKSEGQKSPELIKLLNAISDTSDYTKNNKGRFKL